MNNNSLTFHFFTLYTYPQKTLWKTVDNDIFFNYPTTLVHNSNDTNILYTSYTHLIENYISYNFQYFINKINYLCSYSHTLLKLLIIYKKRK